MEWGLCTDRILRSILEIIWSGLKYLRPQKAVASWVYVHLF